MSTDGTISPEEEITLTFTWEQIRMMHTALMNIAPSVALFLREAAADAITHHSIELIHLRQLDHVLQCVQEEREGEQ